MLNLNLNPSEIVVKYFLYVAGVPAVIVGVSAVVGYHGYGTERQ